MQVWRVDPQTLAIGGLDPLLCELLQQIPLHADPEDHPAARARLFSPPAAAGEEPALHADWQEYVEPELRQLFESALETVRRDLAGFPPPTPAREYTLRIPIAHLDAWLNALNQARLALAARHEVTERDMERVPAKAARATSPSSRSRFTALLQECILRELAAVTRSCCRKCVQNPCAPRRSG